MAWPLWPFADEQPARTLSAASMGVRAVKLEIYRTALPMRGFAHAAASRDLAEAVVVGITCSDGHVGWGETLPRPYVTGESIESVIEDLSQTIWPVSLAEFGADAWAGRSVLDESAGVPFRDDKGRCINAAACAFDLASLRVFLADAGDGVAPAQGAGRAVKSGGGIDVRVSGVLGSSDPDKTAKRLRRMRWFALRDFKVKLGLGDDVDRENLRVVHRLIGKAVGRGKCTLRVDVNGAWSVETTPQRVAELKQYGVQAVEQPVFCSAGELADLADRCEMPLVADESLLTPEDGAAMVRRPGRLWWNIRLSKNGGLVAALRLARLAGRNRVPFVIGCMAGESGILSAAQRRLLQLCPTPRFVEGNYGRFLLRDDLTKPSVRFGFGGRLKALPGTGLGVSVDTDKLGRYGRLVRTLEA